MNDKNRILAKRQTQFRLGEIVSAILRLFYAVIYTKEASTFPVREQHTLQVSCV